MKRKWVDFKIKKKKGGKRELPWLKKSNRFETSLKDNDMLRVWLIFFN
jgi:hypothetical protein